MAHKLRPRGQAPWSAPNASNPYSSKAMKLAILSLALALTVLAPQNSLRAEEKANPLATALGATGAQAVFSTYFAVAELADLYGAKAYDAKKCVQIASTYAKLTESAKDSLSDLIDSGKLTEADTASVREMIVINDLLGKTANGIVEYVKDPSDENHSNYDKNRQKAWKAISKFLGLGE